MLRTVTKRSDHVSRHVDIAPTVLAVAAVARSGRPGPGAVQIPIDLQYGRGEVGELATDPLRLGTPPGRAVDAAATLLDGSRRPLIVAGGGVVLAGASEQLTALAERLAAPVLTTVEGRGSIPEDHRLSLGPNTDLSAMDPVLAQADVVLAVGTRFQQNNNIHKWLTFPGRLVHLDADATMIGRVHPVEVGLVGDARLGLEALLAATAPDSRDRSWADECRRIRDEVDATSREALGPDLLAIMDAMDEILPDGAIVAKDATVSAYQWGNRLLPVRRPRTALRPVSMAIGPGVPLAVGAAVGSGRPTVVIQGDGGLMLSLGELATAVQHDLPVVVCVFNDRGYGILRFIQDITVAGPAHRGRPGHAPVRSPGRGDGNAFRGGLQPPRVHAGFRRGDHDWRPLAARHRPDRHGPDGRSCPSAAPTGLEGPGDYGVRAGVDREGFLLGVGIGCDAEALQRAGDADVEGGGEDQLHALARGEVLSQPGDRNRKEAPPSCTISSVQSSAARSAAENSGEASQSPSASSWASVTPARRAAGQWPCHSKDERVSSAVRMISNSRSPRSASGSERSGHAIPIHASSMAGALPSIRYSSGTSRPRSRNPSNTLLSTGWSTPASTGSIGSTAAPSRSGRVMGQYLAH